MNLRERFATRCPLMFKKKKKCISSLNLQIHDFPRCISTRLNRKIKIAFMKSTALPNIEIHVFRGFGVQDPHLSHYQMFPKALFFKFLFSFTSFYNICPCKIIIFCLKIKKIIKNLNFWNFIQKVKFYKFYIGRPSHWVLQISGGKSNMF